MKDAKYYITGLISVAIFIYLLKTGERDMANQLFQSLLLILAFVFGINAKGEAKEDDTPQFID